MAFRAPPSRLPLTLEQLAETLVGISVIRFVTADWLKEAQEKGQGPRDQLFKVREKGRGASSARDRLRCRQSNPPTVSPPVLQISLEAPGRVPDGWLVWAAVGMVVSPLLVLGVANLLTEVGYSTGGRGTVDAVAGVIRMDDVTFVSLFLTTASRGAPWPWDQPLLPRAARDPAAPPC